MKETRKPIYWGNEWNIELRGSYYLAMEAINEYFDKKKEVGE